MLSQVAASGTTNGSSLDQLLTLNVSTPSQPLPQQFLPMHQQFPGGGGMMMGPNMASGPPRAPMMMGGGAMMPNPFLMSNPPPVNVGPSPMVFQQPPQRPPMMYGPPQQSLPMFTPTSHMIQQPMQPIQVFFVKLCFIVYRNFLLHFKYL